MIRTDGPYVIEHGDVWFREGSRTILSTGLRHVCDGSGELAIAYAGDVMLHMGSAQSVDAWFNKKGAQYMLIEVSDPVEIVRFPVCDETVAEMNRMSANPNRVSILFDTLTKIGEARPDLLDRPPSF
jgi:hypothetical protein